MTASAVFASLTLALAGAAHAFTPEVVGLHLVSHHFSAAQKGRPAWNDNNPGVYARWSNGFTLGTFYNSERRQSVYAGQTWETPRWCGLAASVTAGAVTGYARPVSPLLAASASVVLVKGTALRVTLLPRAHPRGSAAAHLSVERLF